MLAQVVLDVLRPRRVGVILKESPHASIVGGDRRYVNRATQAVDENSLGEMDSGHVCIITYLSDTVFGRFIRNPC